MDWHNWIFASFFLFVFNEKSGAWFNSILQIPHAFKKKYKQGYKSVNAYRRWCIELSTVQINMLIIEDEINAH